MNGERSQLAMEHEAAHNAPFISPVELSAEMVEGMSWHGQRLVHTLSGEESSLTLFQLWKLEEARGSTGVCPTRV